VVAAAMARQAKIREERGWQVMGKGTRISIEFVESEKRCGDFGIRHATGK
jgi:hypothetical protein